MTPPGAWPPSYRPSCRSTWCSGPARCKPSAGQPPSRTKPNAGEDPISIEPASTNPSSRTPPINATAATTCYYRHHQSNRRPRAPTPTSKVDPGRETTQARLLPQPLEPTAPRCPSQHARRRPKSPSQTMPQRRDICTVLAIRYSRRLYCCKVSIDLPTSTISACGNVALKAGSMENKVFLID